MNQIITQPQLIAALSETVRCDEATATQFITQLFSTISQALTDGRQVKIKGIGTFALGGIDGKTPQFIPDPDMADAINSPFSFFEAVELDSSITEADLAPAIDTDKPAETEATESDENAAGQEHSEAGQDSESDEDPGPATATEATEEPETPGETEKTETPENASPTDEPQNAKDEDDPAPSRRVSPWLTLVIGFIAGVAAGWGISRIQVGKVHEDPAPVQVAEAPDSAVAPRDTVAAAPAQAAIVITDTIQANRFLTTMARRHYGNYEFWVYIYEENADKLGHPDKLTPGTVVTIPPKEKYGIDADNPQSVKLARRKSVEIYARYEK